jgi:serine/threonine protein kinase
MAGDESFTNIDELQLARADALDLARGAVLAGRYEIEATLGRGGAGVVLRAYDRELHEAVAIKVLRPDLGNVARWIERLAREVKLARQLRHPNVCRVFDFEKADGHVFIVMELATGGTLRNELQGGVIAARPLEARLADARAVAAGLAAIHDAGIAHRDVTPQNVLRMADGRLVVSDFGLATEVSSTTTSIHGGTVAYMAPEVVRGQRATFASDVWSLGVVIHEIVFGERPAWSRPVGGAMLSPRGGRPLSGGERRVLEVCRACTADIVDRRPQSAGAVSAWLTGERIGRRPRRRLWAGLSVTLALAAATAAIALRPSPRPSPRPPADASGFVDLADQPADWTASARVLATIDDRIACFSLLPDRKMIRFVWGQPRRAEDLDLGTGTRRPSALVPEAYRDGCAELSPDGKRLAFEGYAPDGRAFAFVSEHADGRAAVPTVAIADPTMSSQPKWLPDGRAFTFDIDHQHMGAFSLDSRRTTVLPDATTGTYHSSMRFVVGPRIFVSAGLGSPDRTDFIALGWPLLAEQARFDLPGLALDLASRDGEILYVAAVNLRPTGDLWRVDLSHRTRARVAMIPGQILRYPLFTDVGLVFSTLKLSSDVWVRQPDGQLQQVTHSGDLINAAPCGPDVIAVREDGEFHDIVRLDRSGHPLAVVTRHGRYVSPGCSPDGTTWYTARWTDHPSLDRCGPAGCEQILDSAADVLTISPDGERIAFVRLRKTEPVVAWISSRGGAVHEVAVNDTGCGPMWASNRSLWISRRRGGRPSWIEIDIDTLQETGKVVTGEKDCSDGNPDPGSPPSFDVRSLRRKTASIRIVPTSLVAP